MSLKLELDSRPTLEDFDDKVQQCTALRLELSSLTEQMMSNEKMIEQMQVELQEERERRIVMMEKHLEERAIQTDVVDSTKVVPADAVLVVKSPSPGAVESTVMPQSRSSAGASSNGYENDDDDDALNNHPKVLYEDELIVFKEKCTNLTADNVRLSREVGELRANMGRFHNNWMYSFMQKYLVPILIFFVAFVFYLLK